MNPKTRTTKIERVRAALRETGALPGRVLGGVEKWVRPGDGRLFIVEQFAGGGVEVYVQVTTENSMDALVEAILAGD